MTLTVKELEKDVLDYLERIKNTPENFKELVDSMVYVEERTGINLDMVASFTFNSWGEFKAISIRLGECPNLDCIMENEKIIANVENIMHWKFKDIDDYIYDYVTKKYSFFDEDNQNYTEEFDDLYEDLWNVIKNNDNFEEFKNKYSYMVVAENIKRTLEKMLEESELASKTEEIHPLKLIHDNNLVINFGVNYKID